MFSNPAQCSGPIFAILKFLEPTESKNNPPIWTSQWQKKIVWAENFVKYKVIKPVLHGLFK